MGVIAFGRPPQEALEQIKQALGMVELIHHIATNPDMGSTIEDLSQKMAQAQQLTEEKRKEVADAEEILAQMREAKEDLTAQKRDHDAKAASEWDSIRKANAELEAKHVSFVQAITKEREATKLSETESARKLESAMLLNREGSERHAKAQKLEREIQAKLEAHEKTVSDWNLSKAQQDAELNDKWNAHAAAMTKLAEDRKVIEAMKKKLEAALNA